MIPSEKAIEDRVQALAKSKGTFQRLVEQYVQLTYPDEFEQFVPYGRNAEDVAVRGWPDAYGLLADDKNRIVAVEATHSPRWKRHLLGDNDRDGDLDKAEERFEPGQLAGFVFVAWAPTPSQENLQPYRERLEECGVPSERIYFIFQKELVSDLRNPRFARVWGDILELPVTSEPFQLIDEVPTLFGREDSPSVFVPARSEYRAGNVHQPDITHQVESRLVNEGWALVRGRGAAGKTVMAISIALGDTFGAPRPVYYLDLSDRGRDIDISTTHTALITIAGQGVLFIVDNVHLFEDVAHQIFNQWKRTPNGSSLLMLGRWVEKGPDPRGRAEPLDALEDSALTLTVGTKELKGVFRRLVRRRGAPDDSERPPRAVLKRWSRIFGGT